jgi:histone acetyltransferase (RNA polymerase elongator complex component)
MSMTIDLHPGEDNHFKKMKHYTIPIFIPGVACPFRCIFCDQQKITGHARLPEPEEVARIIRKHLTTIPAGNSYVEAGFFGGTFTGLPAGSQETLLGTVGPWLSSGAIRSIRVSTRPDFISPGILDLLSRHGVSTIELGAQSMDDGVLTLSCRGHSAKDTETAAAMIRNAGFRLGLQMMTGLPGDSEEKTAFTAMKFVEMKADNVRIYPVVVIRGTVLESMYREGTYAALTLDEGIRWAKRAYLIFTENSIPVIRVGLHPSEGLLDRSEFVAGPFHPSFRELVLTEIWHERFSSFVAGKKGNSVTITINPAERNRAIGYHGKNKVLLKQHFSEVIFKDDPRIRENSFHADHH